MTDDWLLKAEEICMRCGGHCCNEAHPPISKSCHERLLASGVPADAFEHEGYHRLTCRPDGTCTLSKNGKCTIHGIKPETCRAGPFTFDVTPTTISIYLKFESICPVVSLLKEVPEAYRQQYEAAARNISHLVANLTGEELEAICRIDEPETEKVADLPRV